MSLQIAHLKKRFGSHTAVDDISFALERPGVFGLLGRNGAGKTTTIRMILGILEKDGGTILWKGQDIVRERVPFGYLPEERGLYPKIKIKEQLIYFAKLRGLSTSDAKQNMNAWLQRFEVEQYAGAVAEQLSKGNQQKIQLIATLIHNPELIILDEPFSGLDPVNAEMLKGVILELLAAGKYLILSTHQMNTIEEYCEQLIILKEGRSVLQGNLKTIQQGYGRNHLLVHCEQDISELVRELPFSSCVKTPQGFELGITSEDLAYRLLQEIIKREWKLIKFELRAPSLHEIFIEKAGDHA